MRKPFFPRSKTAGRERGFTMALVAVAMVAILAMAALSIDAVALYLAREEAQRAADSAALAGARILSMSGMTGDPNNAGSWSLACGAATSVATAVAQQNKIAGLSLPAAQITVTFPNNAACGSNPIFGVNPQVTVKVSRQNLPTFFARIWSRSTHTVVASATAEAYNPSNSGNFAPSGLVPVQPRCVKPWIVPNQDPWNNGTAFVDPTTGAINNPGVSQLNAGAGVVGEQFVLTSPCRLARANCDVTAVPSNLARQPTYGNKTSLDYVPAQTSGPYTAVSSANGFCANADGYDMASDGCDQGTQYHCGTAAGAIVDLDVGPVNPTVFGGKTASAVQCFSGASGAQDTLQTGTVTTPIYPYQIWAGFDNPLVKAGIVNNNDPITSSNSIVSLPIYDGAALATNNQAVTIVGFLQVFIGASDGLGGFDGNGNPLVTVLNVSGCGTTTTPPVTGTSPVPVRLITAP